MNWTQRQAAPDRFLVSDQPIRCPKCSSNLPAASVVVLRTWVIRGDRVVSIVTGERVACQAPGCAHVYSIGPAGTFQHDPRALPYVPAIVDPGARETRQAASTNGPETPPGEPRKPLLTPLERPGMITEADRKSASHRQRKEARVRAREEFDQQGGAIAWLVLAVMLAVFGAGFVLGWMCHAPRVG